MPYSIRPLLTNDRRQRRLTGRDQISTDGKHLIDGVPFGRPRLKQPRGRPSVSIPPLKRRRITYDSQEEDEDIEDDDGYQPRLLTDRNSTVRFNLPTDDDDADEAWIRPLYRNEDRNNERDRYGGHDSDNASYGDSDSDSDSDDDGNENGGDDSDFADDNPEEDGDLGDDESVNSASELEKELHDLEAENEQLDGIDADPQPELLQEVETMSVDGLSADQRKSLTLLDLDRITALRAAFPTASVGVCEKTLFDCDRDEKIAYRKLRRQHEPKMTIRDMATYFGKLRGGCLDDGADMEDAQSESDATEAESVDSLVKHYDQHGFPSGSIMAGTAATHMAEALRKSGKVVKLPVHTRFDGDPDEGLEEDAEAENEPGNHSSEIQNGYGQELESDQSSSSESDSDSGPEEQSSKPHERLLNGLLEPASRDSSSDSSSSGSGSSSESESDSDNEGDDSDAEANADADIDVDEDSEDDVSFHDTSDDSDSDPSGDSDSSSSDDNSDSESESGSDSGAPLPAAPKPAAKEVPASNSSPALNQVPPGQGKSKTQKRNARKRIARAAKRAAKGDPDGDIEMTEPNPADLSDLAARKAMLMEKLGLSMDDGDNGATTNVTTPSSMNPITNHDDTSLAVVPSVISDAVRGEELATSQKSLEMAGSARGSHSNDHHSGSEGGEQGPTPDEDPELWRQKIVYRAVECCEQGIQLSEPPFPFYQRWDPQQQKRSRFSKRKQRDQAGYYEDENGSQFNKKRKTKTGNNSWGNDDAAWDDSYLGASQYDDSNILLNYDDEVEPTARHETGSTPSENETGDDLPPLPGDLSTLPVLEPREAKPGMILTWKQMILSKATNWNPQVFSLAGAVVDVYDDGSLRVLLAKRDRGIDQNEKEYDDEGNRIYDKFEFPGMDDQPEDETELGYRTLEVMDMMEPRILENPHRAVVAESAPAAQHAITPPQSQPGGPDAEAAADDSHKSSVGDKSTTLDHENAVVPQTQGDTKVDAQPSGETIIPDTNLTPPPTRPEGEVLIGEDRRREISQLINEAGFRKEVDPSIAESGHEQSSSPSRQLEQTLKEAASASYHQNPHMLSSFSNPSQEISQNSSNSSMSLESQPVILEPFRGFSDGIEEPADDRVQYPVLDLPPSDIGSIHSGRQPDPDYSIDLGNTSPNRLESIPDESVPDRPPTPPSKTIKNERKVKPVSPAKSDSSTSSFPSLSEIFLTASTQATQNSSSQAAISSAMKARKSNVASDSEYEEAMRRLDDELQSSGSDSPPKRVKRSPDSAQSLLERPIAKPAIKRVAVNEETLKASTKSSRTGRAEPFTIPKGFQVVSLISSSPAPELVENYADDDVDETYEEADPFTSEPESPGWEKKSRNLRGASMPLSALGVSKRGNIPKRLVSSQGGKLARQQSMPASQKQTKKKTTVKGW